MPSSCLCEYCACRGRCCRFHTSARPGPAGERHTVARSARGRARAARDRPRHLRGVVLRYSLLAWCMCVALPYAIIMPLRYLALAAAAVAASTCWSFQGLPASEPSHDQPGIAPELLEIAHDLRVCHALSFLAWCTCIALLNAIIMPMRSLRLPRPLLPLPHIGPPAQGLRPSVARSRDRPGIAPEQGEIPRHWPAQACRPSPPDPATGPGSRPSWARSLTTWLEQKPAAERRAIPRSARDRARAGRELPTTMARPYCLSEMRMCVTAPTMHA